MDGRPRVLHPAPREDREQGDRHGEEDADGPQSQQRETREQLPRPALPQGRRGVQDAATRQTRHGEVLDLGQGGGELREGASPRVDVEAGAEEAERGGHEEAERKDEATGADP